LEGIRGILDLLHQKIGRNDQYNKERQIEQFMKKQTSIKAKRKSRTPVKHAQPAEKGD